MCIVALNRLFTERESTYFSHGVELMLNAYRLVAILHLNRSKTQHPNDVLQDQTT